jgi:hypothetical protein
MRDKKRAWDGQVGGENEREELLKNSLHKLIANKKIKTKQMEVLHV